MLHTRRAVILATVVVALVSIGATWAALKLDRGGLPSAPFARIAGASGNATGVAISDADVATDGGVFKTIGEAVTLQFGTTELHGEVKAVDSATAVATVRLLDGAVAPGWLAASSYAGSQGSAALFVCIADDGALRSAAAKIDGNEARDLAAVSGTCAAGAVVVADGAGHEILALIVTAEGRQRLVAIESVPLP